MKIEMEIEMEIQMKISNIFHLILKFESLYE